MTHEAYIGLGSNLGDRTAVLEKAITSIALLPDTKILKKSSWYETEAVGGVATQDFINAVILVETGLDPLPLMHALLQIEKDLGRVRNEKWGDRNCDLDLLIYDTLILDDPECALPHPGLKDRKFVLIPLTEIAPDLVVPGLTKKVSYLAKNCKDPHRISRL